ncbi:FliI/YscN family ATPase [Treponema parvum]|uniref:FliI/YscN family ATPase n=1 Tax=Treponema parvum TaxID=138851 RepID=UPI001AEC6332|nr:FliI/YscN family ATPase [Treponema parvum]QTQ15973.1 FliI/YscN family ATPase [Treponema parvum]
MRSSYTAEFDFAKYLNEIKRTETILYVGHVSAVNGLEIESVGPRSVIGEMCTIRIPSTKTELMAEVVGLSGTTVKLTAFGDTKGIEVGCEVVASGNVLQVGVGPKLLGRVIDATGRPCDGLGDVSPEKFYPAVASPPDPMTRKPVERRISTGVRAIDSLLAVGKGQRMGIFAGSGVGKSTLISMIARNTDADINVIALIGERGREVLDFIKRDLGKEGLKRSVVVVATSDQPSICRLRAAYVATAVAEYFRDQGNDVMFMFDSVTRFAQSQREIGLANGEPPAQRGYPPSVFDMIPKLLERTGTNDKGSITAFYTVLVDGDDMNEPITDKVRGTIDGHIVLSRALAQKYHFPAIDVLQSISRLSRRVSGLQTRKACGVIRELMASYATNETLITTGNYQKGNSAFIDRAIEKHDAIENFLKQEEFEKCTMEETLTRLSELSEIEIPEEEFKDDAGMMIRSVAQIADEAAAEE